MSLIDGWRRNTLVTKPGKIAGTGITVSSANDPLPFVKIGNCYRQWLTVDMPMTLSLSSRETRRMPRSSEKKCKAFLEDELKLTFNMDKTHITHVNDGFTFLGHRIIRKRGPRGTMRPVTTILRDKFRNFAHKLVKELSGNYSANKIDLVESLNRKLAGWANFYRFTDYTAVMYGNLYRIVFWKLARWLARKYRTSIKSLVRQWVRCPADGKAKTWLLFGRSGNDNLCGVALRRLVTSRKGQFRWRNPEINPYITRDEERNTVTSRYRDVAMAMSHA